MNRDEDKEKLFFHNLMCKNNVFSYTENVVEESNDRTSEHQRILLECEIRGHRERKKKSLNKKYTCNEIFLKIKDDIYNEMEIRSKSSMNYYENFIECFVYDSYSLIVNEPNNIRDISKYVNKSQYISNVVQTLACKKRANLKLTKRELSTESAIGFLGVEYSKKILPVVMFYNGINTKKLAYEKFPSLGWEYSKKKALLTQEILSEDCVMARCLALISSLISDLQWFKLSSDFYNAFDVVMNRTLDSYKLKQYAEYIKLNYDIKPELFMSNEFFCEERKNFNNSIINMHNTPIEVKEILYDYFYNKQNSNYICASIVDSEINVLAKMCECSESLLGESFVSLTS